MKSLGIGLLTTLQPSDRLFLLNTTQFAFGNKPSLAANCAQDAALSNFLAEALEQLLLNSFERRLTVVNSLSPPFVARTQPTQLTLSKSLKDLYTKSCEGYQKNKSPAGVAGATELQNSSSPGFIMQSTSIALLLFGYAYHQQWYKSRAHATTFIINEIKIIVNFNF